MTGCAARKPTQALPGIPEFAIIVPRQCMEKIELTDHSYCRGTTLKTCAKYGAELAIVSKCDDPDGDRFQDPFHGEASRR